MASSEVMTSSTHSFAYSYRLVKKCFVKICETSKCQNFLIFQPIFIRFSLLCLKNFTLSSEIKLNLLWSSSLMFKNTTESMGLKEKTINFLLLSGPPRALIRNHQRIKEPKLPCAWQNVVKPMECALA